MKQNTKYTNDHAGWTVLSRDGGMVYTPMKNHHYLTSLTPLFWQPHCVKVTKNIHFKLYHLLSSSNVL